MKADKFKPMHAKNPNKSRLNVSNSTEEIEVKRAHATELGRYEVLGDKSKASSLSRNKSNAVSQTLKPTERATVQAYINKAPAHKSRQ